MTAILCYGTGLIEGAVADLIDYDAIRAIEQQEREAERALSEYLRSFSL
jgi:hypothetical protein